MNIFRPILAILILFIPLYPKFPLLNFSSTYVAFRLDDIVIISACLIYLIYQIKKGFPIFKDKIVYVFLAYFVAITASFITAYFIYQTENLSVLLLHFFRRLEYMSLFFISLAALKNKTDVKFTYIVLLLTMVGIAIYGYGQKYLSFPVISTMNEEFSKGQLLQMNVWTRISSTFSGHYDLAAYLSLVLIIIFSVFLITKNVFLKFISLLIFLVGFHLLTLTASRISIFAFWGGGIVSTILIRKYIWVIPLSALVILSILGSQDLNQRLLATLPGIKDKFKPKITIIPTSIPTPIFTPIPTSSLKPTAIIVKITPEKPTPTVFRHGPIDELTPPDIDAGVARSGEIRFNVEWPRAINAFLKNPISGTGLGSITLATDNDYLRLLGESGFLGFCCFLFIPFYLLFSIKKIVFIKNSNIYQKIQLSLVGVFVSIFMNALFIDVFEASKVAYTIWTIFGIYYFLSKITQKS